jgi:hypothetical protein
VRTASFLVGRPTGLIAMSESGIRAFAGLAPDLFACDAAALGLFRNALYKQEKFAPQAFQNRQNFFAGRNVTVIVLEVPIELINVPAIAELKRLSGHPGSRSPSLVFSADGSRFN